MRIVTDSPTKTFVKRHRTAILVTALATTVVVAVLMKRGLSMHDEFLEEKGLLDEYYQPEA